MTSAPSPINLALRLLRHHALATLSLSALAVLPVSLLNEIMHWDMMHPGSYLAELLWLPITAWCNLKLLSGLAPKNAEKASISGQILASSMSAEFLLSLRFCVVLLLALMPVLAFIAIAGLEPHPARGLAALTLAALAAIPCLLWMFRRIFTAPIVLWQGLNASQAIAESHRLSSGKLFKLKGPLLAFAIVLVLQGISLAGLPFELLCAPLAFLLSSAALASGYHILTL